MRIPIPVSGGSFFLWFGAIFLCAGLGLLYGGIQDATRERAFQQRGELVDAVVVSKSIRRASREGNTSTRYEIAYRFRTIDGQTVEGVDAVSAEEWERLEPGWPFSIQYLPDAPQSSRAEGSNGLVSALIMIVLGGVFAPIGGTLVITTGRRLWRERRLLREGATAKGIVVAIEPSRVAVNRVRQWQVRYRYEDHVGRVQEGSTGPLPPAEAHAVAVGDPITVRFDRTRPEESVWEPPPAGTAGETRPRAILKRFANWAVMLGIVFAAIVIAEAVPLVKDVERFTIHYQGPLLGLTIGATFLGFVLFMGSILYRIFGGAGQPMSHGDVEDLARSVRLEAGPAFARVSRYRFWGQSAGASFSDTFTVRQAKDAWRQRAWRTSPAWRANFAVLGGVFLFMVGLLGIFIVVGPNFVKVLCAAALAYALGMIVTAFVRA